MPNGDLTRDEAIALLGDPSSPGTPAALLPTSANEAAATLSMENVRRNLPPEVGDTRRPQQMLGEEPGVPFHEEGLPTWTDLMTKSQANQEEQIKYLARKFGADNVRLNEYQEPVVRIKNPDTGKAEDYPLNPRKLTLDSLTSLARYAPDVVGGILGYAMGGPGGFLKKAFQSAIGSEAGGLMREIVAGAGGRVAAQGPAAALQTPISGPALAHAEMVPVDVLADLGLGGIVKGGQAVKNLGWPKMFGGKGINIPNPVGGTILTQPARPEFTKAGVSAAQELQSLSGINPRLRGSESSGIPVHAMIEQYFERTAAGASPQIAAGAAREQASKDIQNWMVDPRTLKTDEAVARRGLNVLKGTVEPYEKDVALAQFAHEAEQKGMARVSSAKTAAATQQAQQQLTSKQTDEILKGMNVASIPDKGVDLAPTGEALAGKAIAMRDAVEKQNEALYDAFRAHPKAKDPIVPGDYLKASLDALLTDLPKVRKTVLTPSKLLGPTGAPVSIPVPTDVPVPTPIRPRLEKLSKLLTDGTVSINDLKEIRTDVGNAMKYGEPFAGYKEGRLKYMYKSLSNAIDDGLKQINDPTLTKLWNAANSHYEASVKPFEHRSVAPLFKEADQAGAVGPNAFTRKAMNDPDVYNALKTFYGAASPEVKLLHETVKNKTLSDALAPDGLIDGEQLTRLLKTMKDERPVIFNDVFGGKGNDLIKAANQLGSWQRKVPIEEVNKLLSPGGPPGAPSVKLLQLQAAQKRLNEEYAIGPIHDYLTGKIPAADLNPEKLISGLTDYKLSDVREVMARLQREDPEIADQWRRKTIQNLLVESRRSATSTDAMAKTLGEPGDLINATGLQNALGRGDKYEKYKAILGPAFDKLLLFTRMELLGQQRREVAGSVGLLVPGSAVGQLRKALTPWEGHDKGKGIMMELGGLARDKIFSIAISSPKIQNWLASPYALKDAPRAMRLMIMSEPFIKGMLSEFKDKQVLSQALSALKVAFGTAGETEAQGPREGDLTREQANQLVPR